MYKNGDYNPNRQSPVILTDWAARVSNRLNIGPATALVLRDEQVLAEQGLISGRIGSRDNREENQSVNEINGRLTDLGIRFCKNIETYHLETSTG